MSRKLVVGLVIIAVLLLVCCGAGTAGSSTELLHDAIDQRLAAMRISLVDQVRLDELSRGEGSLPGCGVDLVNQVVRVPSGFTGRCRFDVADSKGLSRELTLSLVDGGSAIRVNLVLALEDGKSATLGDTLGREDDDAEPLTLNVPDGSYLLLQNCIGAAQPCILVVR